ncbi:hypothetical protein N656DRAFT_171709 [Canariomyces notabilis]|uniref:Uncharacterized protein n=1 Tax=Canariomyces notabilis TaxID=2074819 RepID=A0AAN6YQH3_9PEZI|nr:hypothetical protein N656DRAFT_171709 [Canariomyces arenarius]
MSERQKQMEDSRITCIVTQFFFSLIANQFAEYFFTSISNLILSSFTHSSPTPPTIPASGLARLVASVASHERGFGNDTSCRASLRLLVAAGESKTGFGLRRLGPVRVAEAELHRAKQSR